jgi:hypothetical protein
MTKRAFTKLVVSTLVVLFTFYWGESAAHGGGVVRAIGGRILFPNGTPLPGCSVFYVSPTFRSRPSITHGDGRYLVILPESLAFDPDSGYIEIYWGEQLHFRRLIARYVEQVVPLGEDPSFGDTWSTDSLDPSDPRMQELMLRDVRLGTAD